MKKIILILCVILVCFTQVATAQNAGDYQTTGSGTWSSAAIWEVFDGADFNPAGTPPNSADGVIFIQSGHTVTLASNLTVDEVIVDVGATLALNATLNVADGSGDDLIVDGTYNLNTGAGVTGAGIIVINGTMNWAAGTLGTDLYIAPGGILNNYSFNKTFNAAKTLTNQGTLNWTDVAWNVSGSSTVINEGEMNATGNTVMNGPIAGNFFINASGGVFNKTTGAGTTSFALDVINDGVINGNDATISFTHDVTSSNEITMNAGTTLTIGGGGIFTNDGIINIDSATLNAGGNFIINNDIFFTDSCSLNMSGNTEVNIFLDLPSPVSVSYISGSLSGSGSFTVNGHMTWTAGNLSTEFTISTDAILTISGNNKGLSGGRTFYQNGTMNWSGGNFLFQDFILENNGNINLTSNNGFVLSAAGSNLLLNNASGVFTKSVLTGTTSFGIPVTNTGIIKGIGILSFTDDFTNDGFLAPGLSPGLLTVNGTQPFSAASTLSIEMEDGSGAGTGHDQMTRAGNLTLDGVLDVIETGIVPDGSYTIISLTSGTITGSFAGENLPPDYTLSQTATTVVLTKNSVVPLKLINLHAKVISEKVQLSWQTLTESNTRFFEIQKKVNGSYMSIGNVTAAGFSNQLLNYHFDDKRPEHGVNLYRLKLVDADGSFEYSKEVFVNLKNAGMVTIFPNPAREVVSIHAPWPVTNLEIVDAQGRLIGKLNPTADDRYNVQHLPAGVYYIIVRSKDDSQSIRLIKK